MTAETRASVTDRIYETLIEQQATFYDGWRSAFDRYHRYNQSLLEGGRQSAREWADVMRTWATRPTDVVGVYEAVADAVGSGQARGLALAREWIEDRAEGQRDVREAARRSLGDVRQAVKEAQETAPELLRNVRGRRSNGARQAAATD
jgi:hypothetical protein